MTPKTVAEIERLRGQRVNVDGSETAGAEEVVAA
jgi:hypothetical protein